jgi:4-amino-4-deoxy-L-arabinose transferase-like glycosyltransferase
MDRLNRPRDGYALLCGAGALLAAGLLLYSQTWAFAWDEGFHLVAAQAIKAGKRPYLDFCFPQTPLNAYWNAAWMRIFGESWRVLHAVAALTTAGAAMLAAGFVFTRFPDFRWRLPAAIATLLAIGLNTMVVEFGPLGQAYALSLFLLVAAFRAVVVAAERRGLAMAALAGFLVSAAAGSSLLTAAAAPVLFVWLLVYEQTGRRWSKLAVLAAAGVIPFLPVIRLAPIGPHQVWFNLFRYQAVYRSTNWGGATVHDLEVLTNWIDSVQALSLGLLAVMGLLSIRKLSGWDRKLRAPFYLCGWLVLGIGAELAIAHPTFERYFLLIVPFLAILAAVGLWLAGTRLDAADRPWRALLVLAILLGCGLGKGIYADKNSFRWKDFEEISRKVAAVTPPSDALFADEMVYFVMRRPPPSGMEFSYSHELELPPEEAALLHILPKSVLKWQLAAGKYATAETCEDESDIEEMKLPEIYVQKEQLAGCTIFWELRH